MILKTLKKKLIPIKSNTMKKLILLVLILIGSYKSFSQNDTIIHLSPQTTRLIIKDLINHDRLLIENSLLSKQIENFKYKVQTQSTQLEYLNSQNRNYKLINEYRENQINNYESFNKKLKEDLKQQKRNNKLLKFTAIGLGITTSILILK